jgi:hypothetical protein
MFPTIYLLKKNLQVRYCFRIIQLLTYDGDWIRFVGFPIQSNRANITNELMLVTNIGWISMVLAMKSGRSSLVVKGCWRTCQYVNAVVP